MYEEPKGPIETLEEDLEKTIKHWWMFLILGILAIGVGIWLFFTPMQGYAALTVFFALTFLISGLASIFVTSLTVRPFRPGAGIWYPVFSCWCLGLFWWQT